MPYVYTLDATTPADVDLVSAGAGKIRALTGALIERLNSFFVDSNTSPLTGKSGASMAATTFTGLITGQAGLTISSGTSALQAVTATTIVTSSTINSQTISATASFTGTVTVATGLTVSAGGAAITGDSTVTGVLTTTSTLVVNTGLVRSAAATDINLQPGAGAFNGIRISGTTGLTTIFDGLTVSTGGAAITGNSTVTGTVTLNGSNPAIAIGDATSTAAIRMLGRTAGSTFKNWQISQGLITAADVLDFTPSTAAGGSSFTTSVMTLSSAGALSLSGDFAVNTSKFTVAAASGNTVVAGTLDVSGTITTAGGAQNVPSLDSGSSATFALANTATAILGTSRSYGLITVANLTEGSAALYLACGTGAAVRLITASTVNYGTAQGTAGDINVYVTGGNLTIENQRGTSQNLRVMTFTLN